MKVFTYLSLLLICSLYSCQNSSKKPTTESAEETPAEEVNIIPNLLLNQMSVFAQKLGCGDAQISIQGERSRMVPCIGTENEYNQITSTSPYMDEEFIIITYDVEVPEAEYFITHVLTKMEGTWGLTHEIEGKFVAIRDFNKDQTAEILVNELSPYSSGEAGKYALYSFEDQEPRLVGYYGSYDWNMMTEGQKIELSVTGEHVTENILTQTFDEDEDGGRETAQKENQYSHSDFYSLFRPEKELNSITDYYRELVIQFPVDFVELIKAGDSWKVEYSGYELILDEPNGFLEINMDEADKQVTQVALFKDREKRGILAVNRYVLEDNWYTWRIPKGEIPRFYIWEEYRFEELTYDLFNNMKPHDFSTDRSIDMPDPHFVLPRYGTQIGYVIYPEIYRTFLEMEEWPAVDGGSPPARDWIKKVESKSLASYNIKDDTVFIGFDKDLKNFYVVE